MAEPEKPVEPGLSIPMPWGGKVTANGFDVVLLLGMTVLGVMLYKQNDLLHQQTVELRTERIAEHNLIRCNLGLDIFVHQYSPGQINWDKLPVQLYGCLRDYQEKMRGKMTLDLPVLVRGLLRKLEEAAAANDKDEVLRLLKILRSECTRQIDKVREAL